MMSTVILILGIVLMAAGVAMLPRKPLFAPALAYLGMFAVSFCEKDGYPVLPINNVILTGWLSMTIIVTLATFIQPEAVRSQSRGMGYMIVGALAGMAVGLAGFSFGASLAVLYGIMIVATVAGIFFGFLLYTNTPEGRPVALGSGNFFKYLLAKGFPTAITVMQIGVVLVIAIAVAGVRAGASY